MNIFNFLSNPWIVGIGGGIISGFIVTLITRYLYGRKEQREYKQRVETANNEIIYTLRPTIAEKTIPAPEILDALFTATARRYRVNISDLLSKDELVSELMKEIMDNSFLSSNQKVEFCSLLSKMKTQIPEKKPSKVIIIKEREAFDPSFTLGLSTAIMAMMISMLMFLKDKSFLLGGGVFERYFTILIVLITTPVMSFLLIDILKKFLQIRKGKLIDTLDVLEKGPSSLEKQQEEKYIQKMNKKNSKENKIKEE